ncbi:breast carcinoma amplified sequence 3 domain-containing protein [Ditylenchus destructor]|uniref:Breast carcinoma amplified sequence 3 domain-containing protein n=1 Tax=Ditylenchus destructor TaxID=166010 RepID=A0AAD4NJL2_9BILA|nr:breast carcinoma amplified sequence 3 domain-containing protein [Ditylenchus destructor]
MSISQHGKQQKRNNNAINNSASSNNKKNQGLSTAAVYPILQPKQQIQNNSVPDVANGAVDVTATAVNRQRLAYVQKGQCMRPRPIVEHTIATSVAEFVSEVIPQGGSQSASQSEPIYWVKTQKCACDFRGRPSTFIIVIGLARGYQIWMMLENGDCEEVASERKGPLKVGHLLPFSTNSGGMADRFHNHRPLFAIVDGNPMSATSQENKYCSVSFLSLKQGKIVHKLEFNDPIMNMDSSKECLLVILSESLVICDHETLTQRHCIAVPPPEAPMLSPCYALSDNFLSFAETSVNKSIRCCGGAMPDEEVSYGGQVMSAAKSISKTVSSIGESFVSSFSSSSVPQHNNKHNSASINSDNHDMADSGIVSVIDVNTQSQPGETFPTSRHYVAHFIAHDSPVGFIGFGNGGQLLLTSTRTSTIFHLFLLHPHPTSTKLGAVQHIYTLHRGNSAAKVINSVFTPDNRWLAISTNHGTTHLYAITPYGGPVSARTHYGKFVNKESRFERTAGFTSTEQLAKHLHHPNGVINGLKPPPVPQAFKEHPAIVSYPTISRTVVNPRLTYYPTPIVLTSLAKIKQRILSAESLSAWASDNTPTLLSSASSRRHHRGGPGCSQTSWVNDASRRLAVIFGSSFGDQSSAAPNYLCLFTMNAEGLFTEYRIDIRRERHNSSGSSSSLNMGDTLSSSPANTGGLAHMANMNHNSKFGHQQDTPVRARVTPAFQWALKRNRGSSGVDLIDPPLLESNALMQFCPAQKMVNGIESEKIEPMNSAWLPHVEVVTYCGPHRRLWMGPQFSFGIYATSGHSSAQLFNPKDPSGPTAQTKCCPVLIEKNPSTALGLLNCDTGSLDSASRIVCGSWSSEVDFKGAFSDGSYAAVKEKIEDAMRTQQDSKYNGDVDDKVSG